MFCFWASYILALCSRETTVLTFHAHQAPSDKGSTIKGKILLPSGVDPFLSRPIHKGGNSWGIYYGLVSNPPVLHTFLSLTIQCEKHAVYLYIYIIHYKIYIKKLVFGHMRTAMAQISLRIRAYWSGTLTVRLQNQWIFQIVWMDSKCPWYFAHAQEDLNLRILRMLDGTFLLDTAHILCEQQAFQSSHLALYIFYDWYLSYFGYNKSHWSSLLFQTDYLATVVLIMYSP